MCKDKTIAERCQICVIARGVLSYGVSDRICLSCFCSRLHSADETSIFTLTVSSNGTHYLVQKGVRKDG